jgi:hypothetical protein
VLSDLDFDAKRRKWQFLVGIYSSCLLTVRTDRLPAIAGLAKVFELHMSSDYVYGLWKSALLPGLLWYVFYWPQHPRPTLRRAPSWSWASVDSEIMYCAEDDWGDMTSNVRILECHCSPLSVDASGAVQRGYIRLQCELTPVKLYIEYRSTVGGDPVLDECQTWMGSEDGKWIMVHLDCPMEVGMHANGYYCVKVVSWSERTTLDEGRKEKERATEGIVQHSWLVLRERANPIERHEQLRAFERIGALPYDRRGWSDRAFTNGGMSDPVEILLV